MAKLFESVSEFKGATVVIRDTDITFRRVVLSDLDFIDECRDAAKAGDGLAIYKMVFAQLDAESKSQFNDSVDTFLEVLTPVEFSKLISAWEKTEKDSMPALPKK